MSHSNTQPEPLITFGQLLKIKREQLGYTVQEIVNKSRISQISAYETSKVYPTKKSLNRLISFYGITHDEMKNCRHNASKNPLTLTVAPKHQLTIANIIEEIKRIIFTVNQLEDIGGVAKKLKLDSLDNLRHTEELLNDILILDRLL